MLKEEEEAAAYDTEEQWQEADKHIIQKDDGMQRPKLVAIYKPTKHSSLHGPHLTSNHQEKRINDRGLGPTV